MVYFSSCSTLTHWGAALMAISQSRHGSTGSSGKCWSNTKATFSGIHHIIVSASCLDHTLTSTWPQWFTFPALLPTKLSIQRLFSASLAVRDVPNPPQLYFWLNLLTKQWKTILNQETCENLLDWFPAEWNMSAVDCGCFLYNEKGSEKYLSYLKVLSIHNRCAQTRLSSCLDLSAVPTFDWSPQTHHNHSGSCVCGVHEHREHP